MPANELKLTRKRRVILIEPGPIHYVWQSIDLPSTHCFSCDAGYVHHPDKGVLVELMKTGGLITVRRIEFASQKDRWLLESE